MKLEFDNEKDKDMFRAMLDNFSELQAQFEPDEIDFLKRMYKELNK